jgi:urate oxidase
MKIHYGKAAIPVYRSDGVRRLFAAEVGLDVHGERFLPSYTKGDNSMVVATDTMKNFVHASALDFEGDVLEDFLELVGSRFLDSYGDVERVRLTARELPFARESDVLFRLLEADRAVAELELDRTGILDQRSGRHGLRLLKITGSSFTSFARDEHTTLPERLDRPLLVHLDLSWSHRDPRERVRSEDVRSSVLATFDGFVSMSIQHLVHEMGTRLLAEFPAIEEVAFEAENRTWDPVMSSETDPRVKVYTEPRPAHGVISLTIRR